MDALKELLGEELYNQLVAKLGDKKVAIVSDGNWIPKDKFNDAIEAKKQLETAKTQLEADIKERDKQLVDLKKNAGDNEDLKKQIETLQTENKQKDTDYQAKLKDVSVTSAIEKALIGANAKFPDLLFGKIDKNKIELLQDGTVKGLEDQIKPLRETYKDLFGEEKIVGGDPNKGGNPDPNPDLSKMTDAEYYQHIQSQKK